MKARIVHAIRVIGVIGLLSSVLMYWYSLQDAITFNGKELAAILLLIGGLYLTFGTKESFESWKIDFHKVSEDEEDEEYYYDAVES